IDRCLIKRRDDRIESAEALLVELESVSRPHRGRDDGTSPYPGLAAFQEHDADRFYGREQVIRQVVIRLAERPLVALIGASGAGKSSLVRAGVIPRLMRDESWEAFVLRPGSRPLSALAEILLQYSWNTTTGSGEGTDRSAGGRHAGNTAGGDAVAAAGQRERMVAVLREQPGYVGAMLRSRARRKLEHILVFVDQFEELYTLASEDERDIFVDCLRGAADEVGSPLRVIVSMRSDFLDRVTESSASFSNLISRGITLLRPMDRDGLRQALIEPADGVEYRFQSDALVDEFLGALEHTAGALPLLQFTAAKLWELRDREQRVLTEDSYRQLGGVAGTLANHADAVLTGMTPTQRRWVRAIFARLVTPERTRAVVSMDELRELAGADPSAEMAGPDRAAGDDASQSPAAQLDWVLSRLLDARLLAVAGTGQGDNTVEIIHESLIERWPTLVGWLSENEDEAAFLARLRSAAQEW
ncbi:MAG: protein kinase, partial [Proteobacteria bacterium]|nr:protein kinase [Pseudomonadota bacterium]